MPCKAGERKRLTGSSACERAVCKTQKRYRLDHELEPAANERRSQSV